MERSPVGGVRGKEGLVVSKLCGVNATIIIFVFVVTSGHTLFHLMRFLFEPSSLKVKFSVSRKVYVSKSFRYF